MQLNKELLYDDWHFDMIDEKHIRYTSQVEKQKPFVVEYAKAMVVVQTFSYLK